MRLKSKQNKNRNAENPTDENENDIHVDPKGTPLSIIVKTWDVF